MDGGYAHVSNGRIEAGYTYFAQFVLHDLTHGPGRGEAPRLRLSALFGGGDATPEGRLAEGPELGPGLLPDLPRDPAGRALVVDPRNDLTIMVGQVQSLFTRLYNGVYDQALRGGRGPAAAARRAHGDTLDLYQRLVLEDLLPRLVSSDVLAGQSVARRFKPPPERLETTFTLGAGRFGHAMVKPRYRLNDVHDAPVFRFAPISSSEVSSSIQADKRLSDLRGQLLAPDIGLRWENFLSVGHPMKVQAAARINTSVCRPLFEAPIPGASALERSIPYRTLAAAERAGVPSGQVVARDLGAAPIDEDLLWRDAPDLRGAPAPLWFYVLREADVQADGARLGEVGGTLVADALLGALSADRRLPIGSPAAPARLAEVLRRLDLHGSTGGQAGDDFDTPAFPYAREAARRSGADA